MARWEPHAQERLRESALSLFRERGYDGVTVEDIAARAGLTERTFFRHFSDKREVLFSGSSALAKLMVEAIVSAPGGSAPLEAVIGALEATSPFFAARREHARERHALLAAHDELRERELIKLASLGRAIGEVLVARGVEETSAQLVAETGITIFNNAFERWVADDTGRAFAEHVQVVTAALRGLLTVAPSRPLR